MIKGITSAIRHPTTLVDKALSIGTSNKAGGIQGITIAAEDVIIGDWDGISHTFTPGLDQPDAVRVIARRQEGYADGPISTFLARVLGIDTLDVRMDATAALTGQSTTEPGELELPIGISHYFFQDGEVFCNDFIVFNPTNDPDSCAGWNSYDISPPNDNLLRQILDGSVTSPGTTANDTAFNFIGGNLSNPTFDELLLLFMEKATILIVQTPILRDPVQLIEWRSYNRTITRWNPNRNGSLLGRGRTGLLSGRQTESNTEKLA